MGRVLKYFRLKEGMSQEEVSESIVSPSYLSRIENNKTTVEPETLMLLLERVGVNYDEIQANEEKLKKLLRQWEEPLLNNDKQASEKIYQELKSFITPVTNTNLQAEYHIKRVRACIILQAFDDIDDSILFINDIHDTLTSRNRFFYYKHLGNYYWVKNQPMVAKEHFEKALSEYSSVDLSELEQADLYFLYALTLYVSQNETLSFSYAQSALLLFQNNYKSRQCLKIHIHLGICYSRLGDVPSSLSNFEKAESLARDIGDQDHLGIIYHNIATMHLRKRERKISLDQLENALYYKKKTSTSYMKSLVLLVLIYYQENEKDTCMKYLNEHLEVAKQLPEDNIHTKEYWFFHSFFFQSEKEWEIYVKKTFLPSLKKEQKNQEIQRYSRFLGEYYEGKGGYKKAAEYYKLALDSNPVAVY
ncbi:helix-turn-helix transcriptional regulator [Halobacillus sp. Cin3]|uniref:helix-turn-helix domain-containing protein n=1 Tax=Halobacillus sp. Cin3 TaxID=2928441 RepID=UPI00248E5E2E|nr:helix-turn-helix transcriptional regulator [Halobacillus sp. Cin3]